MHVVAILLLVVATAAAFSPVGNQGQHNALGTELKMGFLDGLFGPKSAEASHILLTGPNASARCENLKMEIYKKAVGGGELSGGIEAEKLMSAVSLSSNLAILGFLFCYLFCGKLRQAFTCILLMIV